MSMQSDGALRAIDHFARDRELQATCPHCKFKVFPFSGISSLMINLEVPGNFRRLWDDENVPLESFVMSSLSEKVPKGK